MNLKELYYKQRFDEFECIIGSDSSPIKKLSAIAAGGYFNNTIPFDSAFYDWSQHVGPQYKDYKFELNYKCKNSRITTIDFLQYLETCCSDMFNSYYDDYLIEDYDDTEFFDYIYDRPEYVCNFVTVLKDGKCVRDIELSLLDIVNIFLEVIKTHRTDSFSL